METTNPGNTTSAAPQKKILIHQCTNDRLWYHPNNNKDCLRKEYLVVGEDKDHYYVDAPQLKTGKVKDDVWRHKSVLKFDASEVETGANQE